MAMTNREVMAAMEEFCNELDELHRKYSFLLNETNGNFAYLTVSSALSNLSTAKSDLKDRIKRLKNG